MAADLFNLIYEAIKKCPLSQRAICKIVGYSSTNQLTRILQKQATPARAAEFIQRMLIHADELSLTCDHIEAFTVALSTFSPEQTQEETALRFFHLLSEINPSTHADRDIYLCSIEDGSQTTMHEFYAHATDLRITMIGCHEAAFFESIDHLSQHCNVSVDFFYREGATAADAVSMLEAVFQFQHKSWFHPVCIRTSNRVGISGLLNADIIFIDATFITNGIPTHCANMVVPNDAGRALLFPLPFPHIHTHTMLSPTAQDLYSLKIANDKTQDYMGYLKFIQTLEHNHSVFRIKPDIGLEMIPAHIQIAAFRENTNTAALFTPEMQQQLFDIQDSRYKNSQRKKQRQYHIFSYAAMRRFAKTGLLSDHFWAFRALKPAERLRILEDLYQRSFDNPNFFCLFLKSDVHFVADEIVWYEDAGISFLLPNTHYALSENHSELFLRDASFSRFFSGYFRKFLCANYAYSQGESSKMLLRLIDDLKLSLP